MLHNLEEEIIFKKWYSKAKNVLCSNPQDAIFLYEYHECIFVQITYGEKNSTYSQMKL